MSKHYLSNKVVAVFDILVIIESTVSVELANKYNSIKYQGIGELYELLKKYLHDVKVGLREYECSLSFDSNNQVIYYTNGESVYKFNQWMFDGTFYFEQIQ